MANITMKELLDAGAHFGHQTQRWNPKMKPYVYTARGGIHIIDLQKSVLRAKEAADYVKSMAAKGGRMIFVGTKKQAVEPIKQAAQKCGQFYVAKRWLGGTLTNFQTIKSSIDRLKKIDRMREKGELDYFSKKERSGMEKEYAKLNEYLEGIREMKDAPACLFVVDINKEHIAVAEARRLKIPVVAIADTNTDPEVVDYPIPGNDDAIRSITLFANLMAEAHAEGTELWKESLKARTEEPAQTKEAAVEEVEKPEKAGRTAGPGGPAVVKVSRSRRLVAAGTAEEVEIALELEEEQSSPESAAEAPDEKSEE